MEALAARERWPRADIEAWQLERLNAVWGHAVSHVPHYRDLAARLALPPRFQALEEFRSTVPLLPRAALKDQPRRLLSARPAHGGWHVSSGSTGTPTAFYWGHDAHREALRCRYRMHAAWGVDIFDRTAFLWSDPAAHVAGWSGPLARVRQSTADRLRRRLRLPAYRLDPADLRALLPRLEAFQPAALYAYTTAAHLLAMEAERSGWRPHSLRLSVVSGEPTSRGAIEVIERAFGGSAVVEYGATECPVIAFEAPDRTLRVREDFVLLETLPSSIGRHEVVLTVLGNPSFPLIRYAIGDVTDMALAVPAVGFAILANVAGRANDAIVARSGRLIHPARFDFLFGRRLAPLVRRYRIHQVADGAVAVSVEMAGPAPPRDVARLRRELADLLEGYPVTVELTSALAQPGRKHRWTSSDLCSALDSQRQESAGPAAPRRIA
jgi:phenylacetate-CoA ligase